LTWSATSGSGKLPQKSHKFYFFPKGQKIYFWVRLKNTWVSPLFFAGQKSGWAGSGQGPSPTKIYQKIN